VEVVASLSQGRTAAAPCGLFTHKLVPVIFEPPCIYEGLGIIFLYNFIYPDSTGNGYHQQTGSKIDISFTWLPCRCFRFYKESIHFNGRCVFFKLWDIEIFQNLIHSLSLVRKTRWFIAINITILSQFHPNSMLIVYAPTAHFNIIILVVP